MGSARVAVEAMPKKTTPVRLSDESIRWARIASGYTGESMAEYASRIVAERGKQDAERLHAEATDETPKRGRREKGPAGALGRRAPRCDPFFDNPRVGSRLR